jgi:hypothetical protein
MPDMPHIDLITKRIHNAMSAPFETAGQKIKLELNIYVSSSTGSNEIVESPENVNVGGLSLTQARKPTFDE